MTDKKDFPPLAHKMGFVRRVAESKEYKGDSFLEFGLSVNQNYDKDDPDRSVWVNVSVWSDKLKPVALSLEKGDRVVVEGNYKEREGSGKVFRDLRAFAIWRAVEIKPGEDEDDL